MLCIAHASTIASFCEVQCIARGSNYLILRIAEKQVGEQDIMLVPKSTDASTVFLNQVHFFHPHKSIDTARYSLGKERFESGNSALGRSCIRKTFSNASSIECEKVRSVAFFSLFRDCH